MNAATPEGRNSGAFAPPALKTYAGELGLDAPRFGACLDGGKYAARVRDETAAATARGVTSTPTLFVAGKKLPGVPTWEELVRAVLEAPRG